MNLTYYDFIKKYNYFDRTITSHIFFFKKYFFLKNVYSKIKKLKIPVIENVDFNYLVQKNELKLKLHLFLYFTYLRNNYLTYRYFFGFPKKLKGTKSNGNSSKNKKTIFRSFLINFLYQKSFQKLNKSNKQNYCVFEFFNKMWFSY